MNYYDNIRPDIRESLDRYAEHGVPVGGFLTAVLCNYLMEAVGRADKYNRETLYEICMYVYNEMPSACHGSLASVVAWTRRNNQTEVTQ
jgi:hypothetical protein